MAVAYMILAHIADAQLRQLVDVLLEDERSWVYLHMDAKTNDLGWLTGFRHPRFQLAPRVPLHWAGFSMVRAVQSLLRTAYGNPQAQKFVLLTSSCFPLKEARLLNDTLLAQPGTRFSIWGEIDPRGKSKQLGRYILSHYYPYDSELLNPRRNRLTHLLWVAYSRLNRLVGYRRRLPAQRFWKGSAYFLADREWAADAVADQPSLDHALKYAHGSDEIYFATLYGRRRLERGEPIQITAENEELQNLHFIRKHPRRRSLLAKLTSTYDERRLHPDDIPDAFASGALFTRKCDLETCMRIRHSPLFNGLDAHASLGSMPCS